MRLTMGIDAWTSLALSVGVQTMGKLTVAADPWDWHKEVHRDELQTDLLRTLSPWDVIDSYYLPLPLDFGPMPSIFDLSIGVPQLDALTAPRCYLLKPCVGVNVFCAPCGRSFPLVMDAQNSTLQDSADRLRCPGCSGFIWPWRRAAFISDSPVPEPSAPVSASPTNVLSFLDAHKRKDSRNAKN